MINWARTVWYVLTLRCEEADRVRSVAREGGATRAGVIGERLHSALCKNCRHARKRLQELDALIEDLRGPEPGPAPAPMPGDARDRIRAAIESAEKNSG